MLNNKNCLQVVSRKYKFVRLMYEPRDFVFKLIFLGLVLSFSVLLIQFRQPTACGASRKTIEDTIANFVENEVIVKFKDYVTEEDKAKLHKRLGVRSFLNSYGNQYYKVRCQDGHVKRMIDAYSRAAVVEFAEPNYIYKALFTPNDEFFDLQWNMKQINCERAWDISSGDGIVVAVVDSGVNPNGIDGFTCDVIQGRDFENRDNDSTDDNGHGTHVAGIIGQSTNNNDGVAAVAFNATIMAVKVLDRRGFGNISSIADGIRWAVDNGAHVINLSVGGNGRSRILESAVNDAHDKGVVVVAAAGNEGGEVVFPAAFEKVIAVGSVRFDEGLSYFSNFGPEIDVVAPGGDLNVDQNDDGFDDGILQETFRMGFFFRRNDEMWDLFRFQGTSFSCPHVSGVAALILSNDSSLTPDEVKERITSTSKDLGREGKDNLFGWGVLDASAALLQQ